MKKNKQKRIIIFLIGFLLIIVPYIKNIEFKQNSRKIDAIITKITPYYVSRGTDYKVKVMYEVGGKVYTGELNYNDNHDIGINEKETIIYNTKNPREITSEENARSGWQLFSVIVGNFIIFFLFIDFFLDESGKTIKERKKLSSTENYNMDVKFTKIYMVISIILFIISIIFFYSKWANNTLLDGIQVFWIMNSSFLLLAGIIQIYFLIKVKNSKPVKKFKK